MSAHSSKWVSWALWISFKFKFPWNKLFLLQGEIVTDLKAMWYAYTSVNNSLSLILHDMCYCAIIVIVTHRQLGGILGACAWGLCWLGTCTSLDHSPARSWCVGTRSGGRCRTAWYVGSAWSRCGGWTGWSGCPRAPMLPATRHANPGPRYTTLTFHTLIFTPCVLFSTGASYSDSPSSTTLLYCTIPTYILVIKIV